MSLLTLRVSGASRRSRGVVGLADAVVETFGGGAAERLTLPGVTVPCLVTTCLGMICVPP